MARDILTEIDGILNIKVANRKGLKFGIKGNHTLIEVGDDPQFPERVLVKTDRGYRWSRGGMVFVEFYQDVRFVTDEEAKAFERDLRSKRQRSEHRHGNP